MIQARLFLLFAAIAIFLVALSAQMVNPAIDSGSGPFSYYSQPTDEIGVMSAPSGTLISPEGFLYTGKRASAPGLSYQAAVAQYKKEYAAHYRQFLRTGN